MLLTLVAVRSEQYNIHNDKSGTSGDINYQQLSLDFYLFGQIRRTGLRSRSRDNNLKVSYSLRKERFLILPYFYEDCSLENSLCQSARKNMKKGLCFFCLGPAGPSPASLCVQISDCLLIPDLADCVSLVQRYKLLSHKLVNFLH